jgi:hypothetical protein
MWRKKLISPEQPIQNLVEYRFKQYFLPIFSYAMAISISSTFLGAIFTLTQAKSTIAVIGDSIIFLLVLIFVETLLAYILPKICDIILTSEGISGLNLRLRRIGMGWQEITLVKSYQMLGMRCLYIKTEYGKNIHLPTRSYKTSQILDRVRELAGEDHILVRALEKELSRPRYELTKLWCGVIGSIVLTMSMYLISGNMYAAEREKPLEQAIASYVRQHPKTPPNQSAIELQALMTKVGLSIEVFGNGSEVKVKPDKAAISEWKAIDTILIDNAKKQFDRREDSKELIPSQLSNYLKTHQADLQAIETHLINNPIPEWGSDSSWVQKSDPKAGDSPLRSKSMNYLCLATLQNLMIVNTLDKQRLPNIDISNDLVAIEKIQKSFQSQPSLIGQLISRIGEYRISRLARQLDKMPTGWGDNLFSQNRHSQIFRAILNEALINSRFFQSPDIFNRILTENRSPLRSIPGYYQLARPRIRLATVDRYMEIQERLIYWSNQNICRTDGESGVKPASKLGLKDYDGLSFITPLDLASQYHKILTKDLLWELTTSVRQAKAKLATGQKVDFVAKEFNLPSKVCPGEHWTAKANDGNITIGFSHPPNWQALGIHPDNIDPLTYTIKPSE